MTAQYTIRLKETKGQAWHCRIEGSPEADDKREFSTRHLSDKGTFLTKKSSKLNQSYTNRSIASSARVRFLTLDFFLLVMLEVRRLLGRLSSAPSVGP